MVRLGEVALDRCAHDGEQVVHHDLEVLLRVLLLEEARVGHVLEVGRNFRRDLFALPALDPGELDEAVGKVHDCGCFSARIGGWHAGLGEQS